MFILETTSDKLTITTDASADVECTASWVDLSAGVATPAGEALASIVSATTVDLVPVPGASTVRNVKHLNVYNNHASTSVTVSIIHTDGTDSVTIAKCVLLAGESIVFNQAGSWTHFDANGGIYAGSPVASQADQEAGTSLTTFVTPGRQHFHPSAAKFWVKWTANSTTILASYNVTSIADTATGEATVTIATDFSGAHYAAQVSVEAANTTWAIANTRECHLRNGTLAAGTFVVDCVDNTPTTSLEKDPATWSCVGYGDQ